MNVYQADFSFQMRLQVERKWIKASEIEAWKFFLISKVAWMDLRETYQLCGRVYVKIGSCYMLWARDRSYLESCLILTYRDIPWKLELQQFENMNGNFNKVVLSGSALKQVSL